jgi:plastocyanin
MTSHGARSLIPTLIGVGLALAAGAQAQPVEDHQADIAFTGQVTSVDAGARTLRVRGPNGEHGLFHVNDEDTTIMSGDKEIALSELQKGDWVSIDADTRADEKVATYIEVVEGPSSASDRAEPTADGATIEVRHNKLSPAVVKIGPGETVTFHNVDKMPGGHTVTAVDGSFSSPPLDKGQDWSHSFDVPGVYPVRIKEHPQAEARIVVE